MADFDYDRLKTTADRLIDQFGRPATLTRSTSSGTAYDPTAGTDGNHDCTVVLTAYKNAEVDGSRILATDKKALLKVGSLAIVPTTADKLTVAGTEHSIVSVDPVEPGAVTLVYKMQVRR